MLQKNKNWSQIFLWLWGLFTLFVILWVFMSSFKTNNEFFTNIWKWPQHINIENYSRVWNINRLDITFFNSLIVVGSSVIGIVMVAAPAAYVLARIDHKLIKRLSSFFSIGLGIPHQLALIPLFFILLRLGLINSLFGLIVVYISLSLPFSIFLLSGFYRSLPRTIEEAALIDGCAPSKAYWLIIFPMSKTGLIPCVMLNFVGLWKEFLLALTFLSKDSLYTLSLGLYALQGSLQYTGDWVGLFAAVIIVILPTFIVFLFLSRLVIEGMTMGVSK